MTTSLDKALNDSYYRWLDKVQGSSNREALALYKKNIGPHLPSSRQAQILDVGCGAGHLLEFLKQSGYRNIKGYEISEPLAKSCTAAGFNVKQGDATVLFESENQKFDMIIMYDVIEHHSKDTGFDLLKSALEKLNPDGELILVCPNMDNPLTANRGRYSDLTHQTGYNFESLGYLLELAGYTNITPYAIDHFVTPYPLLNWTGKILIGVYYFACRSLFYLHGIRSAHVFSKNMLVKARNKSDAIP